MGTVWRRAFPPPAPRSRAFAPPPIPPRTPLAECSCPASSATAGRTWGADASDRHSEQLSENNLTQSS